MNTTTEENNPTTTTAENFTSAILHLPYMEVPIATATDGILAIGEPKARIKEAFIIPTLTAALKLRADWKAKGAPQRTWLIFDFEGDLTPKINELCQALGLSDEIAECGAADDTTAGQLTGRIAIFNWTNPISKLAKDERLTRRFGDAGGTLHNHSKANVANNALDIIQQEKDSPVPALILSDRLLYPPRVNTGGTPAPGNTTRDSNRRWPEPWQVGRQALYNQVNCMVILGHTHLIHLAEEDTEFAFYDLIKTKYFWRCQHMATSRKVKEWAGFLDTQKTLPENATFHLEPGGNPRSQFPGEIIELHWENPGQGMPLATHWAQTKLKPLGGAPNP